MDPELKLLLLDNYDSFTFNLYQQLLVVGAQYNAVVHVVRNDQEPLDRLLATSWDGMVISPGPGTPDQTGVAAEFLNAVQGKIPVLGVCLGHQLLATVFGGTVHRASSPVHGKACPILHRRSGLFSGLPSPFSVARYHSLLVDSREVPTNFSVDAWSESGEVMALTDEAKLLYGVQFHPESFLTEYGSVLIANFLQIVELNRSSRAFQRFGERRPPEANAIEEESSALSCNAIRGQQD